MLKLNLLIRYSFVLSPAKMKFNLLSLCQNIDCECNDKFAIPVNLTCEKQGILWVCHSEMRSLIIKFVAWPKLGDRVYLWGLYIICISLS